MVPIGHPGNAHHMHATPHHIPPPPQSASGPNALCPNQSNANKASTTVVCIFFPIVFDTVDISCQDILPTTENVRI